MAARAQVPQSTIDRLPMYLRALWQCQVGRQEVISSGEIAALCGTNAAQVRKDLSYLGELGTRGLGYDVRLLIGNLSEVLGITESRRTALVGVGRLGEALVGYRGFAERGFETVALFDADPAKIGVELDGLTVLPVDDLETVIAERDVEIVLIATPPEVAQTIADRVVRAGVRAILNLAPVRLEVPAGVAVRQVCLSADLQVLSFHLAHRSL